MKLQAANDSEIKLPRSIKQLRALAPDYDGFILDLWGVIHDGQHLYPGAKACLEGLRAAGKRICFLSNAPRRAARAIEGLDRLGIDRDLYDAVVTSGEVTHQLLTEKREEYTEGFGLTYLFIGPDRDRDLLAGTAFRDTSASEASFVLNAGFDDDDLELKSYLPMLEEALSHGLPMICANPDTIIVRINGEPFPCAGLLAEAYAEMGGTVHYVGKPFETVYRTCLEKLQDIAPQRILAVGDNLDTDILGGNRLNLDTALISGGILKHALGLPEGGIPDAQSLQQLMSYTGAVPDYVLPTFVW